MYLWKFWRDTRRGVFVYLGLLAVGAAFWVAGMYKMNHAGHITDQFGFPWVIEVGVTFAFAYLCALVMAFVTGNNNVGSDIGKGTGDFLLTRPRSRAYFVWTGWVAGLAELAALILISIIVVFALSVFMMGAAWRRVASPFHFAPPGNGQSGALDVPLMIATIVLTAAVVYGLTYFLSVALRNGQRGVVWSIAILFAYSILSAVLKQFAGITLPSVNLADAASHEPSAWYLAPSVQIIGWTLLSFAFPFAAQMSLDRADT